MDPIDVNLTTSRRHGKMLAAFAVLALGVAIATGWQARTTPATAAAPSPTALAVAVPKASPRAAQMQFEPNRGQAAAETKFIARDAGFTVEVLADGMRLRERSGQHDAAPHEATMRFVGARRGGSFEPGERADGVSHYLVGADASRWLRDVPRYRQLRYASLYDGIDLVYYGLESAFEYDLVVRPGADPSRIRLDVASGHAPTVAANGDLVLDGPDGRMRMHRPVLYQNVDGVKKTLAGDYVVLASNEVGFRLPEYDRSRPLVIDPTFKLLYSSYFGGVHDDQVGGMVLDAQNNAYVVGNSGSEDWPVSGNAYQPRRKAIGRYVRNVVVTKFDASGNIVYSTFIGGTTNDYGRAIVVDAAGRAYITGTTNSPDFPVTGNAFQTTFAGSQSTYLAVLSPDGSALNYATFYGGSGGSSGSALALEAAGTVVLGGTAGPGLATTAGAYKTTLATGNGAFVARLNPSAAAASQLVAATYYGTDTPAANSLTTGIVEHTMALDPAGTPWITGQAYTNNLPVTAGAVMTSPAAMTSGCNAGSVPLNSFAYVAHLSADLRTLVYASYLSGRTGGPATCAEYGYGLAFDSAGNVYVGGSTSSLAYPTTTAANQATSPANSGFDGYSAFLTKLKADGSAILWSSYFGGNAGRTYMGGLVIDSAGALWTFVSTAGGSNYPVTSDALQRTHGGGTFDAGVAKFDSATGALQYSTFLGGGSDDGPNGMALDSSGNVYLAGSTTSANYPVTSNAFQSAPTPNAFDGSDWFFTILGSGTIGSVLPTSSGNAGSATLTVRGAGFTHGATASLVPASGSPIASSRGDVADDGTSAEFSFALDGASAGGYDLKIVNLDGTTFTRKAAFTVQAGGAPVLGVQVIGRPKIRTGVASTFQVVVSNTGTVDAFFVPVWITVPKSVTVQFDGGSSVPAGSSVFPNGSTNQFPTFIPVVAARSSQTVSVQITSPVDVASFDIGAALQSPWFHSVQQVAAYATARTLPSDCVPDAAYPAFNDCSGLFLVYINAGKTPFALSTVAAPTASRLSAQRVLPATTGASCPANQKPGFLDGVTAGTNDRNANPHTHTPNPYNAFSDPGNWATWQAGYNAGALVGGNTGATGSSTGRIHAEAGCPPDPLPTPPPTTLPTGGSSSGSGGSIDPNDKIGPKGDGSAQHYVRGTAPFTYQVEFENQPTAALPAARVVVTDQLDPTKVDLSTFTLGPISWGSTSVSVPSGLKSYATTVAIDSTISVRVQGSVDVTSGLVRWTFDTIDPVTHLAPSDPTLGFLPPDTDGKKGQGAVTFTVMPKTGLAHATAIANQATVVFDANAPILTPTWTNTIDASVPTSGVQAATGVVGTTNVSVSWSGTDTGSGITAYTVYVSDNGGAYAAWQTNVTATSAVYTGTTGHTYAFYVRATDGAGNAEAAKSTAEATIAVSGAFTDPGSVAADSSSGGGCSIGGDGQRDAGLPVLVILAGLVIARRRRATSLRRAGR
jgi:hypothetical protein